MSAGFGLQPGGSGSGTAAAEACRSLWLEVCRSRGTPRPDPAEVARFLGRLPEEAQSELKQALRLSLNGREKQRELAAISWAAACTRPAYVKQLQAHGLGCTGHTLFAAGLRLMNAGWDMSARVAQLVRNPQDIEELRAALAVQPQTIPAHIEAVPAPADQAGRAASARCGQEDGAPSGPPPQRLPEDAPAPWHGSDMPPLPTPAAVPPWPAEAVSAASVKQAYGDDVEARDRQEIDALLPGTPGRVELKLYGKDAAHTLEAGPHRRGAAFMGAHVVSVESARALPGGGYDWGRKLAVQLTPEEMPAALAVLMNLADAARFGQHGAQRDKFIELRRQAGGLVVVTGQGSAVYAVPVKPGALYYLLSLFARAMAQGLPGASLAEVLALVRASQ